MIVKSSEEFKSAVIKKLSLVNLKAITILYIQIKASLSSVT